MGPLPCMGQNVTIYSPKTANLHTNMSIHGRTWQCKWLTFLLMAGSYSRLSLHFHFLGLNFHGWNPSNELLSSTSLPVGTNPRRIRTRSRAYGHSSDVKKRSVDQSYTFNHVDNASTVINLSGGATTTPRPRTLPRHHQHISSTRNHIDRRRHDSSGRGSSAVGGVHVDEYVGWLGTKCASPLTRILLHRPTGYRPWLCTAKIMFKPRPTFADVFLPPEKVYVSTKQDMIPHCDWADQRQAGAFFQRFAFKAPCKLQN